MHLARDGRTEIPWIPADAWILALGHSPTQSVGGGKIRRWRTCGAYLWLCILAFTLSLSATHSCEALRPFTSHWAPGNSQVAQASGCFVTLSTFPPTWLPGLPSPPRCKLDFSTDFSLKKVAHKALMWRPGPMADLFYSTQQQHRMVNALLAELCHPANTLGLSLGLQAQGFVAGRSGAMGRGTQGWVCYAAVAQTVPVRAHKFSNASQQNHLLI